MHANQIAASEEELFMIHVHMLYRWTRCHLILLKTTSWWNWLSNWRETHLEKPLRCNAPTI